MKPKIDIVHEWILKRKMRPAQFAKRAGLSKQLLHWHKTHPDRPWDAHHALRIELATGGDLTAVVLMTQGLLRKTG